MLTKVVGRLELREERQGLWGTLKPGVCFPFRVGTWALDKTLAIFQVEVPIPPLNKVLKKVSYWPFWLDGKVEKLREHTLQGEIMLSVMLEHN
jgi:hypothetical protein